jgi:hypothetical protein
MLKLTTGKIKYFRDMAAMIRLYFLKEKWPSTLGWC